MNEERSALFRIVLIYAVVGALWILLSDRAVEALFDDPATIVTASMAKGWLFVGATSLLLYLLIRRMSVKLNEARSREMEKADVAGRALHLLDSIVQSSEDAIVAKDLDGRFVLFNEAAGRFVGKAAAEVLGRGDEAIFPPAQAEMMQATGRRIMASGRPEIGEATLDTTTGTRLFRNTLGPLRDSEGRIIGAFGISRDITEYKQAQDELRHERDLANRYLDTMQTVMVALDAEGRITMINRRGCELLGRTSSELLGQSWCATCLPQPEGMEKYLPIFQNIVAGQIEKYRQFENPILCRDGRQRLVSWHNACLVDDGGQIVGTLSSGEDITDRQHAEAELHESEARWIMALEGAGHGVWDWNAISNTVYYSPIWKSMLGYAPDDIGTTLDEWASRVYPDDMPTVQAEIDRHFRGETAIYASEHRLRCKDGSYKWILDQGRVVSRDEAGKPLRVIGTHTDVTTQRAADEELRQRNDELERFNRAAIGREMDIIALKKRVNDLSAELGRPPPFPLAFLKDESQP